MAAKGTRKNKCDAELAETAVAQRISADKRRTYYCGNPKPEADRRALCASNRSRRDGLQSNSRNRARVGG